MECKSDVQTKVTNEEYTLRKKEVSMEDISSKKVSSIWLFMDEIYKVKPGDPVFSPSSLGFLIRIWIRL